MTGRFCVFGLAVLAWGQQPPAASPPPRATPDKFPFTAIANELAKDPHSLTAPLSGIDPKAVLRSQAERALVEEVASEERVPPAAKAALAATEPWKKDVQSPAPGKDGRVVYTFGAGLATIVCAPLRVCVVELQQGEQVIGEPHIGDAVRWSVVPAASGTGNALTYLVVIKPKEPGLDTNLVLPTNRRTYYLRLVSRPEEYLPLIAFSYPDDDLAKWKQAAAARERSREEREASHITPVAAIENLNFDYQVTGGSEYLRPVRVVDDGRKTYIQMPDATAVREAPILVVMRDAKAEMVNYRVKGNLYIVDRLFDHGALLLGTGKKQERVDLVRGRTASLVAGRKGDAIERAFVSLKRKPPEPPVVDEPNTDGSANREQ